MKVFWGVPAQRRLSLALLFWASVAFGWILSPATLSAQSFVISTVAGGVPAPATAAAANVTLGSPGRVTVSPSGNVYFTALNAVFLLSNGTVSRVAGNGTAGYSGDNGPATSAQLNAPQGLYIDSAGDVYIADTQNNVVRYVSAATGVITTLAGNGTPGSNGDYGIPTQAQLDQPTAVAVDSSGNLYICDSANNVIRQVSNGVIVPYLGNYIPGFSGDTTGVISLNNPTDIFFDSAGNLWIADYGNGRIREYGTNGVASTVAGGGTSYTEGGFPLASFLAGPHSVVVDSANNFYIADADQNRVFKVTPTTSTNRITTLAGSATRGFAGDGAAANAAALNTPWGVAIDGSGNVYFVDLNNARVRVVSASTGNISTVAGNGVLHYSGDGGPAQNALLSGPSAVAYSSTGVYIADTANQRVRQISLSGTISTVAGNGTPGYAGDNGAAGSSQLSFPGALAVDASGFVYIADTGNNRVRKMVNGTINTVAGNGTSGYSGDGSSATSATLSSPSGLAVDSAGNIYISDYGNNVIRKVSPAGVISTYAGNGGQGYAGDGGPATAAELNAPLGLALDSSGNLYIADSGNHVVRVVSPAGTIKTFAGTGTLGDAGDGLLAVNALLATPTGIVIDSTGNVYISDAGQNRIRMVTPAGLILTVAGNGKAGYAGDGNPATQAQFNTAAGIAIDPLGNIYIADQFNNAIRFLQPVSPVPSTGSITNGASNLMGPVAPGESVTIYGSGIGPATLTVSQPDVFGNTQTYAGGTRVYFNGVPAPIFYAWAPQVGVVVPYETTPGTALITVQYGDQVSLELPVTVAASAPGLYTTNGSGQGQALAYSHETGIPNTSATAEPRGGEIILYATGAGEVSPSFPDGSANNAGFAHPLLNVTATVGGVSAPVLYSGGDNGLPPGVIRVDVGIPAGVTPGSAVPVVVKIGTASSQTGVTIAVK